MQKPGLSHSCPHTIKKEKDHGDGKTGERGERKNVLCDHKCIQKLRLKNKENFKFNASGEGKPIQLQCHKRGKLVSQLRTESSAGIEHGLERRQADFTEANE